MGHKEDLFCLLFRVILLCDQKDLVGMLKVTVNNIT